MTHKIVSSGLLVVLALVAGHDSAAGAGPAGGTSDALVFERKGDLYAVAVDGSGTVQLTKTRTLEFEPAVSPDGRSIAYACRGPHRNDRALNPWWSGFADLSGGEVWTMGVDGRRPVPLTRGAKDSGPSWSPDGETILFSRFVKGNYWEQCRSIFRVRKSGHELRRLTRIVHAAPGGPRNPIMAPRDLAISPDGRRIVFTDRVTCETTDVLPYLNVVDASGRPTSDLSRQPDIGVDAGNVDPTWSPDGSLIAFARGTWQRKFDIGVYVVHRDGSGLRRVTPKTRSGHSPAWSPDGAWIAFVGRGDLYLIHPDGTGLRQLTRTKGLESSPAWLPQMPGG